MKKITTITALSLAALSLSACGNTHHSSKDSAQEKENSSLKAENSSLKAKKKAQSSSSSVDSQSQSEQHNESTANSSSTRPVATTQEAIAKVRAAKGFAVSNYDITCDDKGGGIFLVNVRQDTDDTPVTGHTAFVGIFQYDANTDTVSQVS